MNSRKLQLKQKKILELLKFSSNKYYFIKPHKELSPVGWHVLHCIFIECLWIRNYFLGDNLMVNKLKNIADAIKIKPNNRGKNLPLYEDILKFSKEIFKENINLLNNKLTKNIKKKYSIECIVNFLVTHHSQHLETIKYILNIINVKYNKNFHDTACEIYPESYYFMPVKIKKGIYKIGSNKNDKCDNEGPETYVETNDYEISNSIITIQNWKAFIDDGGYKNNKFWTKEAWYWINCNSISYPLNWRFINNKISISSHEGYIFPSKRMPVTNISWFEIKAFAKWAKLKLPHEHHWEIASKRIVNKYEVWEWSNNKFYPYKGFKPFPYKNYSMPWFNKNYYTLKGASEYSEKNIKRITFRNFYKPTTRFIFSGGRLSNF